MRLILPKSLLFHSIIFRSDHSFEIFISKDPAHPFSLARCSTLLNYVYSLYWLYVFGRICVWLLHIIAHLTAAKSYSTVTASLTSKPAASLTAHLVYMILSLEQAASTLYICHVVSTLPLLLLSIYSNTFNRYDNYQNSRSHEEAGTNQACLSTVI